MLRSSTGNFRPSSFHLRAQDFVIPLPISHLPLQNRNRYHGKCFAKSPPRSLRHNNGLSVDLSRADGCMWRIHSPWPCSIRSQRVMYITVSNRCCTFAALVLLTSAMICSVRYVALAALFPFSAPSLLRQLDNIDATRWQISITTRLARVMRTTLHPKSKSYLMLTNRMAEKKSSRIWPCQILETLITVFIEDSLHAKSR